MRRLLLVLILSLCFPAVGRAHFLWIVTGSGKDAGRVQVFFGEAAEPDDPDLLDRVLKAEAWSVDRRGEPQKVSLAKGAESLEGKLSGRSQQSPVILKHTYGVFARGESSFLLNYYGKTYPFALPGTWHSIDDSERLPLEIVPSREGKNTLLQVNWKNKPTAGCQVVIVGPGIEDQIEGNTDEAGVFHCTLPKSGLYSIRARLIEEGAGKYNGEDYEASRHYSTLTLRHEPMPLQNARHQLPGLPQGITSFGGAIAGDTLFVYGGNYGSAHEYSHEGQSNDLWALDLAKPAEWKKVAAGPKLQGLAMVEHKGLLHRVGGFTAMNSEDEEQDLRSQNSVARYNPQTDKWQDLPALPEPRSSHDAAVLGDVLYVAGGWHMPGAEGETVWHKTAYALDLGSDARKWKAIASPPFQRRALALAAFNGKLYAIGGMQQAGGPTTKVAVYDPKADSWSSGPELLGTSMDGFGSSAFACDGALYVSTISGSVQRLSDDGKQWELVGQLNHPRFFHRLLPWQNSKLVAVGGGNMSVGKVTEVDLVPVK